MAVAFVIGMDEAGLGPNLGPFVVAASMWEVPGPANRFDFWTSFESVVTRQPKSRDTKLHIADSKQVFQPGRGIGSLERGVWSALSLCGTRVSTFRELCSALSISYDSPRTAQGAPKLGARTRGRSLFDDLDDSIASSGENQIGQKHRHTEAPWCQLSDTPLPLEPHDEPIMDAWKKECDRQGIKLVALKADVVQPNQFNQLVRRFDNKSAATSHIAMRLLAGLWCPNDFEESFVVADKHGGRNQYASLLTEFFPQSDVAVITEGAQCSEYRVGMGTIRFQPRAEEHLPVAMASMTAKYLREVAMREFNDFWRKHLPDIKPTQGYPVDAKRFRAEIASIQKTLGIPDAVLWRER